MHETGTYNGMGMGWVPDRPDFRDYTEKDEPITTLLKKTKVVKAPKALPGSVDLRAWRPPIQDQGPLHPRASQASPVGSVGSS